MITIKTNINKVVQITVEKLESLAQNDKMLRTAATTVLGLMKKRIHEDGLNANGKKIGTYSKGYMKIRTGDFKNATVFKQGKNKGKRKDAGFFTKKKTTFFTQEDEDTVSSRGAFIKIESQRKPRPRYNRTNSTTVILSLTRQMENDMKVIAIGNGYGIGYTNKFNFLKSQYTEATYKMEGKIFSLSAEEKHAVTEIVKKFTADAIS